MIFAEARVLLIFKGKKIKDNILLTIVNRPAPIVSGRGGFILKTRKLTNSCS
jgi:hypothetical protein